ncbi:MAG: hypothetical protein HOP07_14270 [Bacteriovoracaceae bacterium]|nr:hypothetical protein [Bacteriovoracaceae bacterium]
MKLLLLAILTSLSFAAIAQTGELDSTSSCVIVYTKFDISQPNLTIACDGNRVLTHYVSKEDEVQDPEAFRKELFSMFKDLVNSNNQKNCKSYNYEKAWWASCIK